MIEKLKNYLGTGLVFEIEIFGKNHVETLKILTPDHVNFDNTVYPVGQIKPHLRPLSKLTDEITVKGYNGDEPFVPFDEMHQISDYNEFLNQVEIDKFEMSTPKRWSFELVELLCKWHFNIYFEQGEFIEI